MVTRFDIEAIDQAVKGFFTQGFTSVAVKLTGSRMSDGSPHCSVLASWTVEHLQDGSVLYKDQSRSTGRLLVNESTGEQNVCELENYTGSHVSLAEWFLDQCNRSFLNNVDDKIYVYCVLQPMLLARPYVTTDACAWDTTTGPIPVVDPAWRITVDDPTFEVERMFMK